MDPSILTQSDFAPQSEASWRALAAKALKGGDIDAALTSFTDDGLKIAPILPRKVDAVPLFQRQENWSICQRVDDTDVARAASQTTEDVSGGATGISLVFEGAPNAFGYGLPVSKEAVAAVLDPLALTNLTLRIEPHPAARATAEWLVDYLRKRGGDLGGVKLSLGIDPASSFGFSGTKNMSIEALEASFPQSLSGLFAANIPGVLFEADGRAYHNAGASEAQELGAILSVAASHLRMFIEARQPLSYAAAYVGFAVSVDQDQFVSTAKLRALRKVWARVLELCGVVDAKPAAIHAETSMRMMSKLDVETNILRGTIAAFSAVAGGSDSISVLPYTAAHGLPDAFARRVARNTQLILRDEAHVGFVGDPSSGSGSIDELTAEICAAAWAEFQTIESEGGLLRSLLAGKYQSRVSLSAQHRAATFASGKRTIIGTTTHKLTNERAVSTLIAAMAGAAPKGAIFCEAMPVIRDATAFEVTS
jgi:methylmalonyl-CoA mutase